VSDRLEAAARGLWEEETPVLGLPQPWDEQPEDMKEDYRIAARRTVEAFLDAGPPPLRFCKTHQSQAYRDDSVTQCWYADSWGKPQGCEIVTMVEVDSE